jgi:GNAT superfamily N-acetyltransferase
MIKIAGTDDDIARCYPVMAQLRPHLSRDEFIARVKRQSMDSRFKLIYLADGEAVLAVGGIRIGEWLAGGKYLEIEDLVTADGVRSEGYGGRLFDRIVEMAKAEGCNELRLVSSVTRYDAHRFYFNKKMIIEAHYFSMKLS